MVSKADIAQMAFNLFDSYDKDNSGYLDQKEFRIIMTEVFHEVSKTYPVDQKHLNQTFTIYDSNSDSKLSRK